MKYKIKFPVKSVYGYKTNILNRVHVSHFGFIDGGYQVYKIDDRLLNFIISNKIKIHFCKNRNYYANRNKGNLVFFNSKNEFFNIKNCRLKKLTNCSFNTKNKYGTCFIEYGRYYNIGSTHMYVSKKQLIKIKLMF